MRLIWHSWFIGFGLTLAFELPILLWLLRHVEPRWPRRLCAAFFANLSTHPLVWFLISMLPLHFEIRAAISEVWAILIEAWFYATFLQKREPMVALRASLLANVTSFALGCLVLARYGRWLLS